MTFIYQVFDSAYKMSWQAKLLLLALVALFYYVHTIYFKGNAAAVPAQFKGATPREDALPMDEPVAKEDDGSYKRGSFVPEIGAFYFKKNTKAVDFKDLANSGHAWKYILKGRGFPVIFEGENEIKDTKIKIKPTFKKPSCSCSSAQALASGDMDAIKDEAKGAAMDSIEKVELAVFCENTPDFKVFKTVTRDKFDQMMELVDLAKSL